MGLQAVGEMLVLQLCSLYPRGYAGAQHLALSLAHLIAAEWKGES